MTRRAATASAKHRPANFRSAARTARGISPEEWQARVELAAAYRLTAMMGWTDMLGTHISCRVPGTHDQFLINPYGLLFEEMTASDLIKCGIEGGKLSESPYEVNSAGFTIHSAIHMNCPGADAVMHCHTQYGVAVASQKDGLLPLTQMALTALSQVRYHDFEGVAEDHNERERLVKDLGDGGMLILRNHGTLSVGTSIGEMFARMYRPTSCAAAPLSANCAATEATKRACFVLHNFPILGCALRCPIQPMIFSPVYARARSCRIDSSLFFPTFAAISNR
jgi:ribulose-5-phosphate 4-epimerase/fuculose-1-phosphate aldolase